MCCSFVSTALTVVLSGLVTLSTAAVLPPPSEHENHLPRRGNLSTLSTSTVKSSLLSTNHGNSSTLSADSPKFSTANTNPKLGGWCTFHLTYTVSDQLGFSIFQFDLYDAEGAGVAFGQPTQALRYQWLDSDGNENFNKPALHFGSRLPYDITVLPHPHENLTWAYNEFSMEIPRPDECRGNHQKPITVGTDPVILSVGCFQNTGQYKREALFGDPGVEPYTGPGRKYEARSQIDGGWSC